MSPRRLANGATQSQAGANDPANRYWQRVGPDYEQAFRALRMQPIFVEVTNSAEIEKGIAQIASQRADALVVRGDSQGARSHDPAITDAARGRGASVIDRSGWIS